MPAGVAEEGRSHHRREAQTTPTSKPAEAPQHRTTSQTGPTGASGLCPATSPPLGASPPDATSCSGRPSRVGKGLSHCQPSTLARGHPGRDSGLQGGPGHPGSQAHSPHSRLEGRVRESRFLSSCLGSDSETLGPLRAPTAGPLPQT